jgi:hypothetical protein
MPMLRREALAHARSKLDAIAIQVRTMGLLLPSTPPEIRAIATILRNAADKAYSDASQVPDRESR